MFGDLHQVADHEEWLALVEKSETGVYVAQGFVLYDADTEKFVTVQKVAQQIFKRLFNRQGWDRRFAKMVMPLRSFSAPPPGDINEGNPGSYQTNLSKAGAWFAVVPTDYLDQLDDESAMVFDLREQKPHFTVWAVEATAIRTGGEGYPMLPEFEYRVENAIVDGGLCQYHDHPDAERMARRRGLI